VPEALLLQLVADSDTAIRWPRLALKMIRWRRWFMAMVITPFPLLKEKAV
jgi:hypothetical protein